MATKATPRPWHVTDRGMIESVHGTTTIADVHDAGQDRDPRADANADLIVRAVNNHDSLVETLRWVLYSLQVSDSTNDNFVEVCKAGDATLAEAAEGEDHA